MFMCSISVFTYLCALCVVVGAAVGAAVSAAVGAAVGAAAAAAAAQALLVTALSLNSPAPTSSAPTSSASIPPPSGTCRFATLRYSDCLQWLVFIKILKIWLMWVHLPLLAPLDLIQPL